MHPQRGVASLAITIVLFLLVAAALTNSQILTASARRDNTASDLRVQALYLAESGIERATQYFIAGTKSCTALGESVTMAPYGSIVITNGVASGTNSANCVVMVTGTTTAGAVTRTIQATLAPPSAPTATKGTTNTFTCATSGSANQLASISVGWTITDTATNNSVASVSGIVLDGVAAQAVSGQQASAVVKNGNNATTFYSQNWYVLNPRGSATLSGAVTFVAPSSAAIRQIVSCTVLAGVDQTTPVNAFASATGTSTGSTSTPFGVSISPSVVNTMLIDNVVRDNGGTMSAVASTSPLRTELYNFTGFISGAGSVMGPILTATATSLNWTANKSVAWTDSAVAYQGIVTGSTRAKVRQTGGGVLAWNEVVASPP